MSTSKYAKVLSDGTKPSAIRRLVASSTNTRSVQGGPRSSNQRCAQPSIWISSPRCSRRWRGSGLDHPTAQRLARDPQIMAVFELLGGQGWAEVRIGLAHQGYGLVAQESRQAIVGGSVAAPICDCSWTTILKAAP